MGLFLLLLTAFSTNEARAESVSAKTVNGRTILVAENCQSFDPVTRAIQTWNQRQGEKADFREGCRCTQAPRSAPTCELDVTTALPKAVRGIVGLNPTHPGPNCFNSTLIAQGLMDQRRYVGEDEMAFWLEKSCVQKNPTEPILPGDLVTFRASQSIGALFGLPMIQHSMIYLNDELVFSKNGLEADRSFELQSLAKVAKKYKVDPACFKIKTRSELCKSQVLHYRCTSTFPWNDAAQCKPHLEYMQGQLLTTECKVSQYTTKTLPIQKTQVDSLILATQVIDAVAERRLEKEEPMDPDEKTFWQYVRVKADSFISALENLKP